jgi:hypothetical protein
VQSAAIGRIDAQLAERIGATGPGKLRKMLAALVGIGHQLEPERESTP